MLNIYKELVIDNMYEFIVNEKYVCEYLLPLCDERTFEHMS